MIAAPYLFKFQFDRRARTSAKFSLVIGGAIVAAALIVQTGATGFRFGSPMFELWAALLMISATALLLHPRFVVYRRSSHRTFDDSLVWQDQFANNEQEPPLVLIASGDVFMRSALDFHLTRAGYRVEHADTCDETIAKISTRPEVALLDLSMGNGNRFYCLRNVRKASPSTKVIGFTPKRQPEDAVTCRKLGAYDSMPKPFDPNDVVAKVARALSGERADEISFLLSA
jgi:ActR/RegA family two-component response regulator